MRIKVYLFSKYAKARAQSISVFVLSIFTNEVKEVTDILVTSCILQLTFDWSAEPASS